MKTTPVKFFSILLFSSLMAPLCMAENWPRFRGANGQGISNQSAPIEESK